jgi:sortase B
MPTAKGGNSNHRPSPRSNKEAIALSDKKDNIPDIAGADIDSIIDDARLEELRKKYGVAAGETPVERVVPLETSEPDAGGDSAALPEDPAPFSNEEIQKAVSSFRVVYQDSGSKGFSPQAEKPANIPEAAAEKKEPAVDYLSTMRVVYEAPEDEFPETPIIIQPETGQETPEEHIVEETEAEGGLAELFKDIEDTNPVSKEGTFKRLIKNVLPHKGDGIGEILRKTILNIAIITMLVCGGILLNIYVVSPYISGREMQKVVDLKTNSNISANWATAKEKYPDIDFPTGMQLKFAELYVANRDFSGWLEIPGISINMPIVQGENNAVYLTKSFYGEKSKHGSCFLDSSNNIAQLDRNTIIYGHNMRSDNLMFGPLESYRSIDGFKTAPIITFSTLYEETKWKIYAVFISNGSSGGDNGYLFNYIFRNLSSDNAFQSYITQLDQRKLYTTGVDILPTDKILTLSACVYDFDDARLAVVARMLRDGESEDIDFSKTVAKKNPRYPQAWYSKKGQTNPYRNAEKWTPN